MRFIDGFWLLKAGVKPAYALQVATTSEREGKDGFDLHVSSRPIRHRGDTLQGPVFTVNVHTPTEGVIGVKFEHITSVEPYPSIPLFPDTQPADSAAQLSSDKENGQYTLSTGGLTAEITENPYTLTFKAGKKVLTSAGAKYQGIFDVPTKWTMSSASRTTALATDAASNPNPGSLPETVRYINTELNLSSGELVYGFGEQFGAFVKNGQTMKIWNQDGGTSSDQAYKNVPFYITNRGYGVFINNPGEVEVEVGSEKVSRIGISAATGSLEYFIIYGETPLQILEKYTRMTGRPALLPRWTFGLWLSTSFLTSYSSDTVSGFLQGMQERNCPVRVFHLDCFWMKKYEWCSFTFDPDNFPDPKAYLKSIKDKYNVKICLWINPYISQLSPLFKEGVQNKYFIQRSNGREGEPWQWDLWQPGLVVVDITNPEAVKWYKQKLSDLVDLGVDCFKTDFGERIPHANVKFRDGSDPMRMHNYYSVAYNEIVFNLLEEKLGKGEAVLFARASFAGGQRFPVHWGGDCESTFEAMTETIRGCLSLTASGFGFASHDIGGFEGHPPPEIYRRWVAFGLFSSHSRLHGSSSYRVPWNYGEEAAQEMSKFLEIKSRMMPYLYQLALDAHEKGHPIQRAMFIEFPEDRTTHTLDRQYTLGSSVLVAPVFTPLDEGDHEYYLPAGLWTSFGTDRQLQGPKWVKERVELDEIPLWVRENTVLALGPEGTRVPDYDYTQDLELHVYHLREGATVQAAVPSDKAVSTSSVPVSATREGGKIKIALAGVKVKNVKIFGEGVKAANVTGGKGAQEGKSVVIDVEEGVQELVVEL